jgi:protein-disulfide isomerase
MAAADQKKFWEMCALVQARSKTTEAATATELAQKLGIDVEKFEKAIRENRYGGLIAADVAEGKQRGIQGSTVFLNGNRMEGLITVQNLAQEMDENACCGKASRSTSRTAALKSSL